MLPPGGGNIGFLQQSIAGYVNPTAGPVPGDGQDKQTPCSFSPFCGCLVSLSFVMMREIDRQGTSVVRSTSARAFNTGCLGLGYVGGNHSCCGFRSGSVHRGTDRGHALPWPFLASGAYNPFVSLLVWSQSLGEVCEMDTPLVNVRR